MKKGSPQNQKCRIAHLQLLPLLSGVQRVTLEEVMRLDPIRFEPTVICKEEGPLTEALKTRGIPYFCVPELVRKISPLQDLKAFIRLKRLFSEGRFDIVHTHSSKTGILGRLAGKWAGVPLVIHTVHGFAFPAAKNVFQASFYFLMEWIGARFTDALILLNERDFELAGKILSVPSRKRFLIPNGVDVVRYVSPSPKERNGIREEILGLEKYQVIVGMVGRLWEQKNPELFVKAAIRILRERTDSAVFLLIGDGEEREGLEALVRGAGFENKIRVLGWRDDVDRLLGALDVFVLPSRWEGMPLAILEAMAASLPVVVSNIPGNRDLVKDGEDGVLFVSEDEKDLVNKLRLLIANPSLRARLGRRGKEKIRSAYTLEARISKIQSLYIQPQGFGDRNS